MLLLCPPSLPPQIGWIALNWRQAVNVAGWARGEGNTVGGWLPPSAQGWFPTSLHRSYTSLYVLSHSTVDTGTTCFYDLVEMLLKR